MKSAAQFVGLIGFESLWGLGFRVIPMFWQLRVHWRATFAEPSSSRVSEDWAVF